MARVKVFIEEHLCKTVEIEVPDTMDGLSQEEYAEEKAHGMYRNGEIVLTADDYNGITLCSTEGPDDDATE